MKFKLFCLAALVSLSIPACGKEDDYAQSPAPVEPQAPVPEPTTIPPPSPTPVGTGSPAPTPPRDAFAEIKPLVDKSCAAAGCHAGAGFVQSGAAFKASKAKVRIANKSMPPPASPQGRAFSEAERAVLVRYLSQ